MQAVYAAFADVERPPIGALSASTRQKMQAREKPNMTISTNSSGYSGGGFNQNSREGSGRDRDGSGRDNNNFRGDRGNYRGGSNKNGEGDNGVPSPPKEYQSRFGNGKDAKDPDNVLRQANLILNKLSVTKFTKLSNEFMETLGGKHCDIVILRRAVELIVSKAQVEEHFCFMYADLCRKITDEWTEAVPDDYMTGGTSEAGEESGEKQPEKSEKEEASETPNETRGNIFRVLLLERCQAEFDIDRVTALEKIAAMKELTEEDRVAKEMILKKRYTGHMRFVGEIYMKDLVKASIMNHCLDILMKDQEEDEITCMCKLFMTIGFKIEKYFSKKKDKKEIIKNYFKQIEDMSTNHPNSRARFMLRDLIDMRNSEWTARREEEKAKDLSAFGGKPEETPSSSDTGASSKTPTPLPSSKLQADDWEVVATTKRSKGKETPTPTVTPKAQVSGKGFGNNGSQGADKRKGGGAPNSSNNNSNALPSSRTVRIHKGAEGSNDSQKSKGGASRDKDNNDRDRNKESSSTPRESAPVVESVKAPLLTVLGKPELKRIKGFVEEFYSNSIIEEPYLQIHEMVSPSVMSDVVKMLVVSSLEKKPLERVMLLHLLVQLHHHTSEEEAISDLKALSAKPVASPIGKDLPPPFLSSEQATLGLTAFMDDLDELIIDAPMAGTYCAYIVAGLVLSNVVSFDLFTSIPEESIFTISMKAADFIVQVLASIAQLKDEATAQSIFEQSGLKILPLVLAPPKQTPEEHLEELVVKHFGKVPFAIV